MKFFHVMFFSGTMYNLEGARNVLERYWSLVEHETIVSLQIVREHLQGSELKFDSKFKDKFFGKLNAR